MEKDMLRFLINLLMKESSDEIKNMAMENIKTNH